MGEVVVYNLFIFDMPYYSWWENEAVCSCSFG